MNGTASLEIHITDFLEILPAQCSWRCLFLLGQRIVLEIELVCISLLKGHSTDFLQYRQIVAHRLNAQAFLYHNELLKLTDELFVKLAKGKVGNLEPVIDELSETATSIDIGR